MNLNMKNKWDVMIQIEVWILPVEMCSSCSIKIGTTRENQILVFFKLKEERVKSSPTEEVTEVPFDQRLPNFLDPEHHSPRGGP